MTETWKSKFVGRDGVTYFMTIRYHSNGRVWHWVHCDGWDIETHSG